MDDFFTSMKIRERVKHDIALDKLSVKEYEDPLGIVVSSTKASLRGK